MRISILVENTSKPGLPEGEHGLSLYIEREGSCILFDTGQGSKFEVNAGKMGIDLSEADSAVISHGHYDHGGGIGDFLQSNGHAPVYVQRRAFEPHFWMKPDGSRADIGLDPKLAADERIVPTDGDAEIAKNALLFCEVGDGHPAPVNNRSLFAETDGVIHPDGFEHEQNLMVTENGVSVLIAGCAHRGIANIVDRSRDILGRYPDAVIGGFHLQGRSPKGEGEPEIRELARTLLETGSLYHTGHCTGEAAYRILREEMGSRVQALHTGAVLEF